MEHVGLTARCGNGTSGHVLSSLWMETDDPIRVEMNKTIHRPGEAIHARIVGPSSFDEIAVSIGSYRGLLATRVIRLEDGRGSVSFPYESSYRGGLYVTAYPTKREIRPVDFTWGSHPVIYPCNDELRVEIAPDRETYRPGDDASFELSVRNPRGQPEESALGFFVVNRVLVDSRGPEASFGFASSHSERRHISAVSSDDLLRLDPFQAVPSDLDMIAEILGPHGVPRVFHSNRMDSNRQHVSGRVFERGLERVFGTLISRDLAPLKQTLENHARDGYVPESLDRLNETLAKSGMRLADFPDPWGAPYQAKLERHGRHPRLVLTSCGPDKHCDSKDDFVAFWGPHFAVLPREAIKQSVAAYHERTGRLVQDEATLRAILAGDGIDFNVLRDPWGGSYRFDFEVNRDHYLILVKSPGPNGQFDAENMGRDDGVDEIRYPYFAGVKLEMAEALEAQYRRHREWPSNEAHFLDTLGVGGFAWRELRDPWGRDYYNVFTRTLRYGDRRERRFDINSGTWLMATKTDELVGWIHVRSLGPDGTKGTEDDFDVGSFPSSPGRGHRYRLLRRRRSPQDRRCHQRLHPRCTGCSDFELGS